MGLPPNKTKIVCTIGPASDSPQIMESMILAGMNVARLNFSHGDFSSHGRVIKAIRAASQSVGRRVAIMADLPGPKMRIGQLAQEPIELKAGDDFLLTTHEITGDAHRVSVSFDRLPQAVKQGDALYLNDGYIQLEAVKVDADDVHTRVVVGGELRSRKGLNLPGIDLGIRAFTDHDKACLEFALDQGVDAISQSFVESGEDIQDVREAADKLGHKPFVIAKIERSKAQENLDGILETSDGIMIARGDLGVEIPIERIALAQKVLMRQANIFGKPVITATQMLESMTTNRRPTRAEATDVANAILDGTDGVMLSGESALGKYPVESVEMLAKIAAAIEPHRPAHQVRELLKSMARKGAARPGDIIPYSVEAALAHISPAAVFVPTRSGHSARRITRFRLPVWIVAVSSQESTCQALQFSYGVYPVCEPDHPENWNLYVERWLEEQGVDGDLIVLTEGPSSKHPETNNRMEILELKKERSDVGDQSTLASQFRDL